MTTGLRDRAGISVLVACCLLCVSCAATSRTEGQPEERKATQIPVRSPRPPEENQDSSAPDDAGVPPGRAVPQKTIALPKKLTLKECLLLALRQNTDIAVASLGVDAADARTVSARGEFDPRVFAELSKGRSNSPVAEEPLGRTREAEGALSLGVQQRVPTGTTLELAASADYTREIGGGDTAVNPSYEPELKLSVSQDILKDFGIDINRTSILVAQNNAKIAREELRASVLDNLLEIERAYWELFFGQADLRVRQAQLERAQQLVRKAEAQVEVGISAPLDIVRARSSAASQNVAILQAQNTVTRLKHKILRLLGVLDVRAVEMDFGPADPPPEEVIHTSVEECLAAARKSRPDYLQVQSELKNAELARRLAKNQRLPALQLFGEYGLVGLGDDVRSSADVLGDGKDGSWRVGLRFEVPLPNRAGRGNYRAALSECRRAELRMRALGEKITREIADALANLHTNAQRIAAAREARGLAERVLRDEEVSFSLGRSTSLDVLGAQTALASAERDEVRARADYAIALAALFRAEGNLLERKGIAFIGRER